MNTIIRFLCAFPACVVCLSLLPTSHLLASAFQVGTTPDFAPFILDKRVERDNYNMRLGPVFVDVIGTFGFEYDDNINTSENNEIDDFILQPGISLGVKWQLNETSELDVNLGMEYWYYLSESDLNDFDNQFGITPNSEISFRVSVGDLVFRIYDRFQYSFDSSDSVTLNPDGTVDERDPETFSRFNNVLGVQTDWFIQDYVFSAQLSRMDVYSPDDDFDYVNMHEYKAALNVERALAANFLVGTGVSFATISFDEDVNNDGDVFTVGPYFEWQVTEVITMYAGLAYNQYDYDEGALTDDDAFFGDDSKFNDYTWMLRLSQVVNESFNHNLEWYRAINVGDTSNSEQVDGIRYNAAHNLTSRIRLDGTIGYEESESSGGLIDDDFDRWIAGVSTELILGPRLTAEVGYLYVDKDSDRDLQSYDQNKFRVFFMYDF